MKILKLLNKKNLSIVIISLTFPFLSVAEDELKETTTETSSLADGDATETGGE